jgi:hypothetical protein
LKSCSSPSSSVFSIFLLSILHFLRHLFYLILFPHLSATVLHGPSFPNFFFFISSCFLPFTTVFLSLSLVYFLLFSYHSSLL